MTLDVLNARNGAEEALDMARTGLARAAWCLDHEIHYYPTPVSGCDAQYNHLLAERRRIRRALAALDAEIHVPNARTP